jgi:hypothetical protein
MLARIKGGGRTEVWKVRILQEGGLQTQRLQFSATNLAPTCQQSKQ